MFRIMTSPQAVPRVACTAAVSTFRDGLLRAARGYSSVTTSGMKTGVVNPLDNVESSDSEFVTDDESTDEDELLWGNADYDVDLVIKYLSEENMSRADKLKEELTRVRSAFKMHGADTGSTSVQVALLTTKIKSLLGHLNQHRKDHSSQRGLMGMLSQRQKLLKYIRKKDPEVYQDLILRLGLKDRTYVGSRYLK